MKLTILGKYGPYPEGKNTACSGYLVENEDTKILVDCGSGVLSRLQSTIDIRTLDAIYLTHLHFDHTSDLLPLRYLLDDLNLKLKVITHVTDSDYCNVLLNHNKFNIINVDDTTKLTLGSLKLSFVKLEHPVINHGIIIKGNVKLGITGDTTYCDNVVNMAKECDFLLADCSKPSGFKGPHMNVQNAIDLINESNTTIFSTHATPYKSTDVIFKNQPRIIAVEELKTYEL